MEVQQSALQMTPLEAMRKIVEHGVETDDGTCQFCWAFLQRGNAHEPDCLSLYYPQIVAALEVPDSAIVRELAERGPVLSEHLSCQECGRSFIGMGGEPWTVPHLHEPTCLWRRSRALYPKAVSDADQT